jgi:hypothetical protein
MPGLLPSKSGSDSQSKQNRNTKRGISEEYRRQEKQQDREGDSLIGRQRGSMKKSRFLDMSTMILKA